MVKGVWKLHYPIIRIVEGIEFIQEILILKI